MGKNVAVFVDVANIFYAAKAAGVDIDYVTLMRGATAGRDLVRAYAYTGLDPDNENQRNFHSFLARHGYRVVSKDIRKYGDGKVKANLDIELVVDMMKTSRNLDVAIVVSGDGDFAPAIRAVQEMGVRVEVISFRGNTSSDLIEVADQFTDITALAKVEKGSSRSGRRVATDDEDLSMTEVPDKQTEGVGGRGRSRGGRGRGRPVEAEPVAASSAGRRRLTLLPGERLSGPAAATEGALGTDDISEAEAEGEPETMIGAETFEDGDASRRRRRRRGGRGRGRGRGRADEAPLEPAPAGLDAPEAAEPGEPGEPRELREPREPRRVETEEEFEPAPRLPRPTPFGSVWDSQIGVPTPSSTAGPAPRVGPIDDDDFDEPEIPEYLLAEQRRGRGAPPRGGARGGGPRGGARGSYAAAVDRERYGRGGGGGLNRYPDVSGRGGGGGRGPVERRRDERPAGGGRPDRDRPDRDRPDRPDRPGRSSEPWSEVPPELEQLVRAQLAGGRPERPPQARPFDGRRSEELPETTPDARRPWQQRVQRRRRPRRRSAARPGASRTRPARARSSTAGAGAAPKRRVTRKKADTADATVTQSAGGAADAPKRRTTRKKAEPTVGAEAGDVSAEAPKRRTTRRKAAETAEA